jgi:hypothetical protein
MNFIAGVPCIDGKDVYEAISELNYPSELIFHTLGDSTDWISASQTITLSSSLLFAASPPLLLTASFFSTLTTIPPQTWNTLHTLRSTESTWNAPGRKLLGWGERVARELGRVLAMGCQNRPRERRNGVKSGVQLRNLIDEVRLHLLDCQDGR